MRVQESPSPHPPESTPMPTDGFTASKYQSRLLNSQSAEGVEVLLAASCAVMGFDIAEIWLRTGPKTHQLINSHLRSTSLDETLRDQLVEVYYGDSAAERTHRLSPAVCKKADRSGLYNIYESMAGCAPLPDLDQDEQDQEPHLQN